MKGSDLTQRILVAIPLAVIAVLIVASGGWFFAAGVAAVAVICVHEFCEMTSVRQPVTIASMVSVVAMIVAAQAGGSKALLLAVWATLPLTFGLAVLRPTLDDVGDSIFTTVVGSLWIGGALAQAVLLRDLGHGGGVVLDALIATFAMDSGAYLGGRAFGRRPLALRISPKKTVEGFLAGAATALVAMLIAGLYQDWLGLGAALAIASVATLLAPAGDLFESLIKRDAGIKDTSNVLGPHGGLLDRIDGLLFSVVGIYWIWLLFV